MMLLRVPSQRRPILILLTAALVAAALVPTAAREARAAVTLTPVRAVGGPGHAGLYGWGAATMSDGSLLIGDYWNFRVQHYNTDGTLRRTIVGRDGRHQAPFDVAVDTRDDSVYVADTDGGRNIDKYASDGTYLYSFGSQSVFKYPSWLDVDSAGRVAVADGHGNKVVVYDDRGTLLYSFGTPGSGDGQFRAPRGVGFDANDNLYVADTTNSRIQVYAIGPTSATFVRQWSVPVGDFRGLTVDKARGLVYLVNAGVAQVQTFDLLGTPLATFGGRGFGPGQFSDGGRGITVDGDGNVWVGDMPNFRAQKFSPSGTFLLQAPDPAQPPPPGGFAMPGAAALDAAGNIFVIDTYNWRLQKLDPTGRMIWQKGRRGGAVDKYGLQYPRGVAVDQRDGSVVVADTDNTALKKYTAAGAHVWTATGVKSFSVAIGPDGTVYAPDFQQHVVKTYSAAGAPTGSFGAFALKNPRGIDVDPDGSIWVSSRDSGLVSHFSASGALLAQFGGLGAADGQLAGAADVESDAQHVYVADQTANRIKVWTKAGSSAGSFGGGGKTLGRMFGPVGLDLTAAGRLYVTEFTNERVQEFAVG